MHTGTLIDELMESVERAQAHAEEREREERLAYWYAVAQQEMTEFESNLSGVA